MNQIPIIHVRVLLRILHLFRPSETVYADSKLRRRISYHEINQGRLVMAKWLRLNIEAKASSAHGRVTS